MGSRRRRNSKRRSDDTSRLAAIADAENAAETAATLARQSTEWATRAGVGEEDAAEVVLAAMRAREAAQAALDSRDQDEAWEWARQAWASVCSAQEADARVNSAIVEKLIAA